MNHPSLIEWQKIQRGIRMVWSNMMGAIIALIVGILIGVVYKENDIMEDCKYSGSFRVHTQAYNCQRKI